MPTLRTIYSQIESSNRRLKNEESNAVMLWIRFGQCVRETRKERGISLAQLAKKLGRTPAMLAYMESGERSWPADVAEKVLHILGRPVQWPDAGRGRADVVGQPRP